MVEENGFEKFSLGLDWTGILKLLVYPVLDNIHCRCIHIHADLKCFGTALCLDLVVKEMKGNKNVLSYQLVVTCPFTYLTADSLCLTWGRFIEQPFSNSNSISIFFWGPWHGSFSEKTNWDIGAERVTIWTSPTCMKVSFVLKMMLHEITNLQKEERSFTCIWRDKTSVMLKIISRKTNAYPH